MDKASLEAKKLQYSQRFDQLNQVINDARIEQQQLTGAYNLLIELSNLIKEDVGARSGKVKSGPEPKPTTII